MRRENIREREYRVRHCVVARPASPGLVPRAASARTGVRREVLPGR